MPGHINIHDGAERGRIQLVDRHKAATQHSRTGHQSIQATKAIHRQIKQAVALLLLRHVCPHEDGAPSGGFNLSGCPRALVFKNIADDNSRSPAGKKCGRGSADTPRTTRDDGNLAG